MIITVLILSCVVCLCYLSCLLVFINVCLLSFVCRFCFCFLHIFLNLFLRLLSYICFTFLILLVHHVYSVYVSADNVRYVSLLLPFGAPYVFYHMKMFRPSQYYRCFFLHSLLILLSAVISIVLLLLCILIICMYPLHAKSCCSIILFIPLIFWAWLLHSVLCRLVGHLGRSS